MAGTGTIDYGTVFQSVQTEVVNAINGVLPEALVILAVMLGIGIGYKLYKKFAK
jgi:hypothetical protein